MNGALGLAAPQFLASRVAAAEPPSVAATYAFRMFGIRTILLAAELVVIRDQGRRRTLRRAVVIHGSDTVSAAALALGRRVPGRTGALLTGISATNVALALIALGSRPLVDLHDPPQRPSRRVLGGLW